MSEERENQSRPEKKQATPARKFSKEQYDMLKRCSEKMDITEWNQWRKEHPDEEILLEGADLEEAYLGEANLQKAHLVGADLQKAYLLEANLQEALLFEANLERASLFGANLQEALLAVANLQGAYLRRANLEKAYLSGANLQKAYLRDANLQKADLRGANLQGTNFEFVIVDGSTLITPEAFDRFTNFTGVGLDNARVEPGTKQLLEYNIRRLRWEQWYEGHPKLKSVVEPFWWTSDYGLSTGRIIVTFFGLALIFANVYYYWGRIAPPGIISDLFVETQATGEQVIVQWWLVPLRTLYFSIVTMTTLGFGDMYAKSQSFFGHLLLIVQVLLGYVLLAALVTRFAVLFTAGGPAGRFPAKKKSEEQGTKTDKTENDEQL